MNPTEFFQAYETVSIEMSNPFAKLGNYSLDKFKDFAKSASNFTNHVLSKVDMHHPNGLYVGSTDVERGIEKNQVVYTDLQPVRVYTPDFLKPKTTMLQYALALRNDMLLCQLLTKSAPEELLSIVSGYIGNPKRLQDPILIAPVQQEGQSLIELGKQIELNREINEKLITSTGTRSIRSFSEAYSRIGDYQHTNTVAIEINEIYKKQINGLRAYTKRVEETNKEVARLLEKIQTDPNFAMSSFVGDYLSKQVYRLAMITEYLGACLFNAQIFLKAISDTNIALNKVVK